MDASKLKQIVESKYIPKVNLLMAREVKRSGESNKADIIVRRAKDAAANMGGEDEEESTGVATTKKKKSKDQESDDDDDGEEGDGADAELSSMRNKKKQSTSYEEDDADDVAKDEEGDTMESTKMDMDEDEDEESEDEDDKRAVKKKSKKDKKDKKDKEKSALEKAQEESRRGKLLAGSAYLSDFNHVVREDGEGGYTLHTDVILQVPPSQRKILVSGIAEEAAANVLLNNLKGIKRAFVVENQGKLSIQTDGVNFEAAYNNADVIDITGVTCNDIVAILSNYGVEAARHMIASEVNAVFSAFGIVSDARHLGLLADYMTFLGGYRPLNRMGISTNTSPFCKMSFETTATFLEQAMINGDTDDMSNPSACIVLGKPIASGTGCFDMVQPLSFGRKKKKSNGGMKR